MALGHFNLATHARFKMAGLQTSKIHRHGAGEMPQQFALSTLRQAQAVGIAVLHLRRLLHGMTRRFKSLYRVGGACYWLLT